MAAQASKPTNAWGPAKASHRTGNRYDQQQRLTPSPADVDAGDLQAKLPLEDRDFVEPSSSPPPPQSEAPATGRKISIGGGGGGEVGKESVFDGGLENLSYIESSTVGDDGGRVRDHGGEQHGVGDDGRPARSTNKSSNDEDADSSVSVDEASF